MRSPAQRKFVADATRGPRDGREDALHCPFYADPRKRSLSLT